MRKLVAGTAVFVAVLVAVGVTARPAYASTTPSSTKTPSSAPASGAPSNSKTPSSAPSGSAPSDSKTPTTTRSGSPPSGLIVLGIHHTPQLCAAAGSIPVAGDVPVQIAECNADDAAQNWTVNAGGTITSNGKCLDVTSNGSLAGLGKCDGDASQRWTPTDGTLVNAQFSKCLDDPAWSTVPGTQLDIWACNGGTNQRWTLPGSSIQGNPMPVGAPGNWTLAFDDEFNATSVDTSKWAIGDDAHVNSVTDVPSNVWESDGDLDLQLSDSSTGAVVCSGGSNTPCGGSTPDGYALPVGGYAEARVWFPGSGSDIYNWPAWWASGADWPAAGEVDIAEGLGDLTVNYHSPSGAHNQGAIPGTWSAGWHIYGVLRNASSDDVYWDGKLVKSFPTDDNGQPEALILDVGNSGGGVYGAASVVKVDYVRVWTQPGTGQGQGQGRGKGRGPGKEKGQGDRLGKPVPVPAVGQGPVAVAG